MIKWIKEHRNLADSLLILGGGALLLEIITSGGIIFGGGTLAAIGVFIAMPLMAYDEHLEKKHKKRNRAN